MTTALELYKKFKENVSKTELWLSMLGKQYYGGGGGIGRVICFRPEVIEIYYQFNNGATNYHAVPSEFKGYIQEVLIEKSEEILKEAFVKMQQHQKELAQEALEDYNSVIEDIKKEA